jgi:membrane fusion protein (multidrug efflux system)
MKRHLVAFLAGAALVLVGVLAYFGHQWISPTPKPVGVAADADRSDKSGAAGAKGPGKSAAGGGAPVPVETISLQPGVVQEDLQAVGSLRSNESVILRPEVSGRISTIGFRDGQAVRRGQLLVGLDATLNEAEVAQMRAEFDLATSNLRRTEDLASKNFVSSSAQDQAASSVQVAEAKLKLAEARLAKMRIVAPFDGMVGIRNVSIGDYVKDGTDLVNIEDVRTLKADFRLPERFLTQLKVGQPVEVVADALPTERFAGVIEAINPRIDSSGRALELRARLDNQRERLRPGMFVRVRVIVGERSNALLVPEQAIVPAGDDFFVFKVADGKATRAKVRPGVRREGKVEIVEGLAAGEQIVTAGQQRLVRDGQPVRVVPAGQARGEGGEAPAAPAPAGETKKQG